MGDVDSRENVLVDDSPVHIADVLARLQIGEVACANSSYSAGCRSDGQASYAHSPSGLNCGMTCLVGVVDRIFWTFDYGAFRLNGDRCKRSNLKGRSFPAISQNDCSDKLAADPYRWVVYYHLLNSNPGPLVKLRLVDSSQRGSSCGFSLGLRGRSAALSGLGRYSGNSGGFLGLNPKKNIRSGDDESYHECNYFYG
jgi:hypothetical protein